MLKKRFIGSISLLAVVVVMMTACTGKQVPGWEYMPDMYRSPSTKAYEPKAILKDSLSALHPPLGTIPRGFMSYQPYPSSPEGLEAARANLTLPVDFPTDSITLVAGAKLYGIYCSYCHGDNGDGQGILVEREKILGVPSYADRDINIGTIFHVITYGKGVMGSHASQVTPEERWKISQYVMNLRTALASGGGAAASEGGADTTANTDAANTGTEATNQQTNEG